ncbi:TPA: septum formation initiator family protein, partial [Streptococcus pyogenes]|nr:septum formation initiator family protein [Streptococcus pyogenes]
KLKKEYNELSKSTKKEKQLAERLKDDNFVKKYARAKYYLSREGEMIYPIPGLYQNDDGQYCKKNRSISCFF